MESVILYTAIDRTRIRRAFKTLKGAQRFAQGRVGTTPELAPTYAISGDGIGKIEVRGCTLIDLFPALNTRIEQPAETSAEFQAESDAENAWLRYAELGPLEETEERDDDRQSTASLLRSS